eukprot:TRINITY_DN4062_c0_g3_i1.p1 TRINITY_DN4062_c0_g3~~TRINITY_DN4062_c0_g3_i1.p1  ORF type:complete len:365 (-),score=30.55 TRINITY_DN4062_c0_g3_i1:377-1450(-)
MDVDLPGERLVASILRDRCTLIRDESSACKRIEELRHRPRRILATHDHAWSGKAAGDLGTDFPALAVFGGPYISCAQAVRNVVQKELEAAMRVKCRQCGLMISADMEAVEAHSLVCVPVKCKHCGQLISADVDSIDEAMLAHSSECPSRVDSLSISCWRPTVLTAASSEPSVREAAMLPRPLRPSDDYATVGRTLLGLSATNLETLSAQLQTAGGARPTPEGSFQVDEQFLAELRREMRKQIEATYAQEASARAQSPIQIVIDNTSTSSATQTAQHPHVSVASNAPVGTSSGRDQWWTEVLRSPANRIALFTMMHLSLYLAHGYLNHRYRLVELQHKIDANAVLSFQRMLNSRLKCL